MEFSAPARAHRTAGILGQITELEAHIAGLAGRGRPDVGVTQRMVMAVSTQKLPFSAVGALVGSCPTADLYAASGGFRSGRSLNAVRSF
jgi:hypothetical protein